MSLMLFCFCILCQTLGVEMLSDEAKLSNALLFEYEKVNPYRSNRPVVMSSDRVNVTLGLSLVQIVDYDEDKSLMTVSLFEKYGWGDSYLTWNPSKFGNLQELRLPADRIWIPDITLYNKATPQKELIPPRYVVVTSDGQVVYVPQSVRTVKCMTDPGNPDTAYCSLVYGSWAFDVTQIDIDFPAEDKEEISTAETETLSPSTKWYLDATSARKDVSYYDCCGTFYGQLSFYITIRKEEEDEEAVHKL